MHQYMGKYNQRGVEDAILNLKTGYIYYYMSLSHLHVTCHVFVFLHILHVIFCFMFSIAEETRKLGERKREDDMQQKASCLIPTLGEDTASVHGAHAVGLPRSC